MISYITGNLFDESVDALVQGCNISGRMNAGIAVEFKTRFPEMYQDYLKRCREGTFHLGSGYLYKNSITPHIINLGTQRSLKRAELEDISSSFHWLATNYHDLGIRSIAMPKIGAGLGRLRWAAIQQEIEAYLGTTTIDIRVISKD